MEFREVFKEFRKGLLEDEDLRRGYKDNIAMACYDSILNSFDLLDVIFDHKENLRTACNIGADNFLNLLLAERKDQGTNWDDNQNKNNE